MKRWERLIFRLFTVIARCPFGLLYRLSDLLAFILNYIVRYRKAIIRGNMRKSLPKFSEEKIRCVQRLFYRNLSDYIFETLSCLRLNFETLQKRVEYEGIEFFEKYHSEKKNVFLLIGHLFNWEWLISLGPKLPQKQTYAIYKPINTSLINQLMNTIRGRFGTINLPLAQSVRSLMQLPNDGEHVFLVLGDQSPQKRKIRYSLPFLNQETGVYNGFDKIARKKNMRILYGNILRKKRGHYIIRFVPIEAQGKKFRENEIAEKFFALLEVNILEQPDNWLWSHRRWKHQKGIDF
ncbi:lysophospholipid acyltransferase family protein [Bacteroidetes bacterium endosymbiont of Geopemphigus sp.]|nr:lysophospholipid acyltransferase family protein [Bacteroidetes bacterium endosymbiont of Geopemphigus sp.]